MRISGTVSLTLCFLGIFISWFFYAFLFSIDVPTRIVPGNPVPVVTQVASLRLILEEWSTH